MKQLYIKFISIVEQMVSALGIIKFLKANKHNQFFLYLLSLFCIYDFRKMTDLDLAWWNFKAIDHVNNFLKNKPDAKVFEYGSGASTIWLAKRAREVISAEYDEGFYNELKQYLQLSNVKLLLKKPSANAGSFTSQKKGFENMDFKDLVTAIEEYDKFDIIVIDGRCREKCFEYALKHLNKDGIILFDDVQRNRYMNEVKNTKNISYKIFSGLTPTLPYPNKTAIISLA